MAAQTPTFVQTHDDFPIVIIGAGFAGVGMAIQLKKAGIYSFEMFERGDEIGGTWRDNTYPGAACDVPSHVYSFSFEPNPNWSRAFSESCEIQSYLLAVVEKWQLRPHLRLNTEIIDARFDEESGTWTLTTNAGETVTARVVVSGVGGLVDPALPNIKGLEKFTGDVFHTARWKHDYDLTGQNVAVIGTGFALGLARAPFPVTGRGGKTLDDTWTKGAVAYKGMTVSGFPNWFILMGPNTGPGHTSVLVYTEAQIAYALQAINRLIAEKLRYVDVRQDVQDRYNEGLQRRMPHMAWSSGCHSWYLSDDGSNHALYPGFAFEYVARVRKFKPAEYEIVKS